MIVKCNEHCILQPQNSSFFLLIEALICFVKKFVGKLMMFDNLDYNFSPHQHMFKKAKELSDEKVFLLISSNHITIYNETTSSFSGKTFWKIVKNIQIFF